jgi:hypothetical protein
MASPPMVANSGWLPMANADVVSAKPGCGQVEVWLGGGHGPSMRVTGPEPSSVAEPGLSGEPS